MWRRAAKKPPERRRLAWRVSPALTLTRAAVTFGWVTRQGKTSGCFSFMYNTSVSIPSCSTNGCWLSETQTLWSGTCLQTTNQSILRVTPHVSFSGQDHINITIQFAFLCPVLMSGVSLPAPPWGIIGVFLLIILCFQRL